MKNLYPKGKGRIHPSPAASAATTVSPRGEALSVLQLLPAAILALTVALGNDDKEVLAYLIMRSIGGPAEAAEAAERRRCGKPGELHSPLFGCGCFDCYTSFWSRWDCSPDRELIHQAIEAFEDHLATSERAAGAGNKPRRKERRVGEPPEKGKKKGKEKAKAEVAAVSAHEASFEAGMEGSEKLSVEKGGVAENDVEAVNEPPVATEGEEEMAAAQPAVGGGERRKGWPDVTAIFNSRLWSLWSPGD